MTLESLIGQDHPARLFWDYVCHLDLGPLEDAVEAREGGPGRPIASRRPLLALWLYATSEGVGSARALAELCERHDAYRWLAGGVRLNYHTLSDFRVANVEFLDRLLTKGVVSLREAGLIDLDRLSHDGARVRASAGAASFRRKATLEEQLAKAEELVRLKSETDAHPAASRARLQADRERAARERKARLDAGLAKHARIPAAKAAKGKGDKGETDAPSPGDDARQEDDDAAQGDEKKAANSGRKKAEKPPRVSTTDAEARVMKMADGGFRLAYNAQVTTATGTTIIVGIDVSDNGSDRGLLPAACEQARRRYGAMPGSLLADGGFNSHEAVEKVAEQGVDV